MPAPEVTAEIAWDALHRQPLAVLVDVRTEPEWRYVGEPDLSKVEKRIVQISWHVFPDMATNTAFIDELQQAVPMDGLLYFLCRSGGRSLMAAEAAIAAGFAHSYSVAGGFEGPVDGNGHRGTVAGWKAANLPWRQS